MKTALAAVLLLLLSATASQTVAELVPEDTGDAAVTAAKKSIVVDLKGQRLYAYEGERVIYNFHISSGRQGKRTPKGSFRVLRKEKMHISSIYPKPRGGARMPWSLQYQGPYFIHGYHDVPLRPASNGCVRLAIPSAAKLFAWAPKGTPVKVR